MKPRILINLAFFAALGVVMTIWAFTSVIRLDVLTHPYRISAEFVSSPGLVEQFDVAYLGVRVGKIGAVRLAPGKVVVGLDIDHGVTLPQGITAEVRRKSAIGEPYVELSPPAKETGRTMAEGEVIPLGRTSVPLDYKKLFEGLGRLLNAVPPRDAQIIVHELATGLDGRADSLRGIVDDAHDVTRTLAANSAVLDQLADEVTRLAHTIAGKRDKIASGVTDFHTVTSSLRRSRQDLLRFLDEGPKTFQQIDYLIHTARPGLSCLLTGLGAKPGIVFTPQNEQYIHHMLSIVPTALALADDISVVRSEGTYARAAFIFSVPGGPKVAEEYQNPIGPPKVPALRECPKPGQSWKPAYTLPVGPAKVPGIDDGTSGSGSDDDQGAATASPGASAASATPSAAAPDAGGAGGAGDGGSSVPVLLVAFAAVVLAGGVIGWIAAGRMARGKERP
ncbi:MCE family protein [Streptosporangiaceae bacterium NEAU-GS5]|nr:MCE family protein [Streptosporangiaceae bacterium NEAU-GS5]